MLLLALADVSSSPWRGANAQEQTTGLAGLGPPVGSTCDMATLNSRFTALQAACGGGDAGAPACDVDCASVLLPLLADCRDVLNHFYDEADGVEDGEASVFTDSYNQCRAIPSPVLLDELKTMQEEGRCPGADLDGIGETEVKAGGCIDRMTGGRCGLSIASGIFSCEHDFCDTVYPPCPMAGQCEQSCGFCPGQGEDAGSGHRLLLSKLAELLRRRQLQIGSQMVCDPATFSEQVGAVDTACCDTGGACDGTGGVPDSCDAKCAIVYRSFYTRCQRFMSAQFSQAQMGSFDQLFTTCSSALPAEPLLRAAIACRANPVDPCYGVDCGEHGRCAVGSCQCDAGYSGATCDLVDPCYGVDCGAHGTCEQGACDCRNGYTGNHCQTRGPVECCSTCEGCQPCSECGECRSCGYCGNCMMRIRNYPGGLPACQDESCGCSCCDDSC